MSRNHNYKGGSITSHQYKIQYVGKDHHLADIRGYAYEHRLEAEKKIGRRLEEDELVHHIDENTLNNAHDNLQVLTPAQHMLIHRKQGSNLKLPGQENTMIACACGCGAMFLQFDSVGRPRKFISGHNLLAKNKV